MCWSAECRNAAAFGREEERGKNSVEEEGEEWRPLLLGVKLLQLELAVLQAAELA